jgi:hypothetical protein
MQEHISRADAIEGSSQLDAAAMKFRNPIARQRARGGGSIQDQKLN